MCRSLTACLPFKAQANIMPRFAFQPHAIIADDQDSSEAAIEDNRSVAFCLVKVRNAGNTNLHWQSVGKQTVACLDSLVCVHHAGKQASARHKRVNDLSHEAQLTA